MKTFLFLLSSFFFLSLFIFSCTSDDDEKVIEIVLYRNSVQVERTKKDTVRIMQGNGGYTVSSEDEEVAVATMPEGGNMIIVEGIFVGDTKIEIKDRQDKTASISVKVPGTALTTEARFLLADPLYNEEDYPTSGYGITYKRTENEAVIFHGNVLALEDGEHSKITAAEILERKGEILNESQPADFSLEIPEGGYLSGSKYYIVKDQDTIRLVRISAITLEENNYYTTWHERHRKDPESSY